jgi:hypothetical protein
MANSWVIVASAGLRLVLSDVGGRQGQGFVRELPRSWADGENLRENPRLACNLGQKLLPFAAHWAYSWGEEPLTHVRPQ